MKYVTDIDGVKSLGFCVSVEHARFMCQYFNDHGIPSMYPIGASPDEEHSTAKQRLVSDEVRFIFVVDIYNEGVDIPEVNTVLFLCPTELQFGARRRRSGSPMRCWRIRMLLQIVQ